MKTPLRSAILQSDIDFNGFKALNNPSGGALGTFVNVKDDPYNAAGDGVTDDTDAITDAISDVVNAGGGTVFFPKGIYIVAGLKVDYNAILQIPFINATSGEAVSLVLLGERPPMWSVLNPTDFANNSTIKTTTAASGTQPALIAANSARNPNDFIAVADMNNIMLTIRNMAFLPGTLNGLRLDGLGWSVVEDVFVEGTGPCGVWLPNQNNFSINYACRVTSAGSTTAIRTGEHLRAPMIQAINCNTGVEFTESIYPSWACIQLINCVYGIKFTGYHIVDLIVETEHDGSSLNEIYDPSNFGTGTIRCMVGQGGGGALTTAPSRNGGTGLTLIDMYAGNIALNTSYGAARPASKITGKGTVPAGGTTGQPLKKLSNADYDVGWA